jgi:predicted Zn-dependent peptidase
VEIRFPIPPGESEANPALDLLVEILNGPSGRLARRLLGPEGIAVSATAARRTTRRWGYFSIRTYPRSNDLLGRAEQSILQELERLGENLVSAEEFERARLKLWARHQATLADTQALARALGEQEVLSGWRDFLQRPDRWSAVTPEALRSLAAATFQPSRRTLGVYRRKEAGR